MVEENKCPCCGVKGLYWDSNRDIANIYGIATQITINTYECSNNHEQVLFATKGVKRLGDFNIIKDRLHFYK